MLCEKAGVDDLALYAQRCADARCAAAASGRVAAALSTRSLVVSKLIKKSKLFTLAVPVIRTSAYMEG